MQAELQEFEDEGWNDCKDKYTNPELDDAYVARRLSLDPLILGELLHRAKRSAGLKGAPVYICLDDGQLYLATWPHAWLGTLT